MVVAEQSIAGVDEMRLVLYYPALCKNRRVDRTGYSPHERVFGSPDGLPGSALDSFLEAENIAGDELALADVAYWRSLHIRAAATAL
eukprot:12900496-Prorocentrum_lima.AAC.1